jgi:hypothetical protein
MCEAVSFAQPPVSVCMDTFQQAMETKYMPLLPYATRTCKTCVATQAGSDLSMD